MYTELACYWRLVSDPANYAEEAAWWRAALRAKLGPGRHRTLELGVGGGNNLSHLTGEFDAVAADVSPQMVEQARKLNPDVEFHVGDMRTLRLGREFQAVLIHDAICYLLTEADLRATFATVAAHLEPGGVFITAPDWYRETFREPFVTHGTNSDGPLTVTTLEYTYDPDPTDTTIDTLMWFLIREGGRLRIEQDRHVMGLFSLGTWVALMQQAEFEVDKLPYDVHEDHREAYLLVGALRNATRP